MKYKALPVIALIFFSVTVYSQTLRTTFRTSDQNINLENHASQDYFYLYNDYKKGVVYFPDGYMETVFNLDLFRNHMLTKNSKGKPKVLNPHSKKPDSIRVGDQLFIYDNTHGFVELLKHEEDYTYFIKYRTDYRAEELSPGAYGSAPTTSSTQRVSVQAIQSGTGYDRQPLTLQNRSSNEVRITLTSGPVFLVKNNNEYTEVKSRRDLRRQFSLSRRDVRRFTRSENINFDERLDIIKLTSFIEDNL